MKFVCGNFKMNGTLKKLPAYIESLNELDKETLHNVCVCLPFPFLGYAHKAHFNVGAQDCSQYAEGAYTGDVSAHMLAECACKYVLVGHSERRLMHYENDRTVYNKAVMASKARLQPIVCIGENEDQISDKYDVLRRQIRAFNPKEYCDEEISELKFAYEPVWAIGTGKVPDEQTISSTCEFISELLIKILGKKIDVLYGGSIKPANAKNILQINTVDGVLVGGACLNAAEFKQIINIAKEM